MTQDTLQPPADKSVNRDGLAKQLAGALAVVAFVVCVLAGGFGADNPIATVLWRALAAMVGVFVVSLVVGLMLQRMLDDDANAARRKLNEELLRDPPTTDAEGDETPGGDR